MARIKVTVFCCLMVALLGMSGNATAQQPVSPYFYGLSMTGGEVGAEPWPIVPFAGLRMWDSAVPWSQLNPAPGVYDWRLLNIWMNHAKQNGVDMDFCFGRVPGWASSKPQDHYCANEPGSCDPPSDLNPDGTGTNQAWRDFVTAIVLHSAGRIHYWELWDEFPNPMRWHWVKNGGTATVQQLLRMAQDARQIIKSIDPTAVIISHSGALRFNGDDTSWQSWAEAGIASYVDRIALHSYVQPNGSEAPIPEALQALLLGSQYYPFAEFGGFYGFLNTYGLTQPLWDTEGSWAADAAGLTDPDEQAGFTARFYAVKLSTTATYGSQTYGPIERFDWYEYDNTGVGALWQWITRWDLALPNSNGNVTVTEGYGDGSFQPPTTHGAGSTPDAVAVGDFNNDGEQDIVVADQAGSNVTVLLNSEKVPGTFGAGITSKTGSAGKSPVAIAVGDFDKDGNLDAVVADSTAGTVTVLFGDGTGNFKSSASYNVGTTPSSVAVSDFNNDGYLDIAVTNSGSGTVSVLLNQGNGKFANASGSPYTVGNGPSSVAAGDFNNDGFSDLAVTNSTDGTVSVLLNNTTGGFGTQSTYTVGNGPSAVAVGYLNTDAYLDLVVANQTDNTVTILLNNGSSGGFSPGYASPYAVGKQPVSVAVNDFDGDGFYDIAVADKGDGTVATIMHCHTGKCKKTKTFFSQAEFTNVGSNPVAMALGDFAVVGSHDPGTLLKPGYAYLTTYGWYVGNTFTPACTGPVPVLVNQNGKQGNAQGVWTCGIQAPNGNQGQLVWYMDETYKIGCLRNACTYKTYQVPSGYTQYQNIYGQTFAVPKSGNVNIGYLPILLEDGNAPVHHDPAVKRRQKINKAGSGFPDSGSAE